MGDTWIAMLLDYPRGARQMLTAIYHMLKDGTMYQDLGRNYFDRRSTDQHKKRLVKRLADLGYAVELKPLAA
jgi:transposase